MAKCVVRNSRLKQIRYVSKDDFSIRPFGQGCIELVFRNARVIFVKGMTKRKVS